MPGIDIFGSLENHRARVEQQRENSARLARAYYLAETTGWGEIVVPNVLDFGVTFLREPHFTSGPILRGDSSGVQGQLVSGRFPRVDVGVWRWEHDAQGYWTGAYIYFVIETLGFQTAVGTVPDTPDPGYHIAHRIIFEAEAYKAVPPDVRA